MIISVGGKLNNRDATTRQSFGTVGGDHVVTNTLGNNSLGNIVDDQDPRVSYGRYASLYPGGAITYTSSRHTGASYGNSYTKLNDEGAAVQLSFNGNYAGIIARRFAESMDILVLIDGKPAKGLVQGATSSLATPAVDASHPLAIDAMTVTIYGDALGVNGWGSKGEICIDNERMTYSNITYDSANDLSTFIISQRGASGTFPAAHSWKSPVYWMTEYVNMSTGKNSGIYDSSSVVYTNPFIGPGDHTITAVAIKNAQGGYQLLFDGFNLAPLQTMNNIGRTYTNVRVDFTTDSAGYYALPSIGNPGNFYIMGYLGSYTVVGPQQAYVFVSNAGNGSPNYVFVTSAPNTNFSVELHFSIVGTL